MASIHAQITQIVASRCCVCKAPLSDAESVEHGIGPWCSKRYYNPLHLPTQEQVMTALGHLAISGLPEHIIDGFIKVVNNDHANARLGSNLLIYWASAHYDDRDEVFKCSTIIRALGYTDLADKLETDRTVAHINSSADPVVAYVGYKFGFQRDMDRIPGVVRNDAKHGAKIGWHIPKDKFGIFMCALGIHYGGELACGTAGVQRIPRHSFMELFYLLNQNPSAPAKAPSNIRLVPVNNKIAVYTPYHKGFITALKTGIPYRDRVWTGKCWEVAAKYLDTVKALVQTHYGVTV